MAGISKTRLHGVLNSVGSCVVRRRHYCAYRGANIYGSRRTPPDFLKPWRKDMIAIQNPVLFAYALGFLFTCVLVLYMYLDTRNTRKK